jgi:hypothetical protein
LVALTLYNYIQEGLTSNLSKDINCPG